MKLQYVDCADKADSADYINLIIKNFGDLLSAKPVESAQSAYKVLGIKNGKPRLTGNGGWMEQTEFESWVRTNAAERERMKKLSAGLSEEELSRPMGAETRHPFQLIPEIIHGLPNLLAPPVIIFQLDPSDGGAELVHPVFVPPHRQTDERL